VQIILDEFTEKEFKTIVVAIYRYWKWNIQRQRYRAVPEAHLEEIKHIEKILLKWCKFGYSQGWMPEMEKYIEEARKAGWREE